MPRCAKNNAQTNANDTDNNTSNNTTTKDNGNTRTLTHTPSKTHQKSSSGVTQSIGGEIGIPHSTLRPFPLDGAAAASSGAFAPGGAAKDNKLESDSRGWQ